MLARYNKAIVAVVWAAILLWNTLKPGEAVDVEQADIADWLERLSILLGPFMVYLVPNKQ